MRVYNPAREEKTYSVRIGESAVTDVAKGGEVVSLTFDGGVWKTEHDRMPV